MTPEERKAALAKALFVAVIEAASPDDWTRHLPNCGYTDEEQTCGCADWGARVKAAIDDTLASLIELEEARQDGAAAVVARVEAVWPDPWCRREDCRWRRWRSGSVPTRLGEVGGRG